MLPLRPFSIALLLSMAGCNLGVDSSFDDYCTEVAKDPSEPGNGPCKYRDNISDADKERLMEAHAMVKKQREVVRDLEAEGVAKGYLKDQ